MLDFMKPSVILTDRSLLCSSGSSMQGVVLGRLLPVQVAAPCPVPVRSLTPKSALQTLSTHVARCEPRQAAVTQSSNEGVVQCLEYLLSAVLPERLRYGIPTYHSYNAKSGLI